jgi:hypothetical protein
MRQIIILVTVAMVTMRMESGGDYHYELCVSSGRWCVGVWTWKNEQRCWLLAGKVHIGLAEEGVAMIVWENTDSEGECRRVAAEHTHMGLVGQKLRVASGEQ